MDTQRDSSGTAPMAGVGEVSDEGESSLRAAVAIAIVVTQVYQALVRSLSPFRGVEDLKLGPSWRGVLRGKLKALCERKLITYRLSMM